MSSNRAVLGILLGVAAVAGCGKYSSPKATFETAWAAAKEGARGALRDCFDKPSQQMLLEIETARAELGKLPKLPASFLDVLIDAAQKGTHSVDRVTREGNVATLNVGLNGKARVMKMVREEGEWKIDASSDLRPVRVLAEAARIAKKMVDRLERSK